MSRKRRRDKTLPNAAMEKSHPTAKRLKSTPTPTPQAVPEHCETLIRSATKATMPQTEKASNAAKEPAEMKERRREIESIVTKLHQDFPILKNRLDCVQRMFNRFPFSYELKELIEDNLAFQVRLSKAGDNTLRLIFPDGADGWHWMWFRRDTYVRPSDHGPYNTYARELRIQFEEILEEQDRALADGRPVSRAYYDETVENISWLYVHCQAEDLFRFEQERVREFVYRQLQEYIENELRYAREFRRAIDAVSFGPRDEGAREQQE